MSEISFQDYILGVPRKTKEALNCILIEIKRYIFYEWANDISDSIKLRILKSKLRRIILLEKRHFHEKNDINGFYEKWKDFTPIYDMFGPDPLL